MAGFEPALSCSRSRRIHQAFPHPESRRTAIDRSAQRESNPHFRRGGAVGSRYIMGTSANRIAKRAPGGTRTHVAALRVRCPRRWTTSADLRSGTRGTRTLTRLVKSQVLCHSSYGPGGRCTVSRSSRPRRSRTFVARLSAECSSVELQAALRFPAMGPEGFEPPPPGLKGRCAAVTPRPPLLG